MEIAFQIKYASTFRLLSTLVHLFGAVHFAITVGYHFEFNHRIEKNYYDSFGWSFKYIITWSAIFNFIHFTISLITDIVIYFRYMYEAPLFLMSIQAYTRACFAFPFSFCFGSIFWILYLTDPTNLYREDEKAPDWLLHMLTTNAFIFNILDVFSFKNEYPKPYRCAGVLFVVFGLYFIWMFIVYSVTGVWIYPIYGKIKFVGKITSYLGAYLYILIFHLIGRLINNSLWDDTFIQWGPRESVATGVYEGRSKYGSRIYGHKDSRPAFLKEKKQTEPNPTSSAVNDK